MSLVPYAAHLSLSPKVSLEVSKPFSEYCQIKAQNDLEAVNCWLEYHRLNEHTYKAYYKEAKRFLTWCIYERGATLGELKVQDFERLVQFLKNPPAHWRINKKKVDLQGIQGPLFKGDLSESALKMSIRALNSMMNYLVKADYLRTNPIKLLPHSLTQSLDRELHKYKVWERMLETDEWAAVQKALEEMPTDTKKAIDNKLRTQFLFALLYLLGLRIHEVAISQWNAFRFRNNAWWFFIKGKGGKLGHIPVNEQLLSYIKAYRLMLGLSPLPTIEENEALIISKRTHKPLTVRQLYQLVKNIGVAAAQQFKNEPLKRKKLEALSPHWLRHLSASHQDKAGIPATLIQANHRHGSYQTTQIYLHAEDELRAHEMQKLKMQVEPQAVVLDKNACPYELKIKLKGGAVSGRMNLSRLLASIEQTLFKGHPWERVEEKEELLNRYEQLKRYGMSVEIVYEIMLQESEGG